MNFSICKKVLLICALSVLSWSNAQAQDAELDLSSQRCEKQSVTSVTGYKREYDGLVINPTPQELVCVRDSFLPINGGWVIKDKQKKFAEELAFLERTGRGTRLTIDFGVKVARKNGVKAVPGAYVLDVDSKGVSIVGYDERGAFYGIQTFKQLLDHAAERHSLPLVSINDYPDLPHRGVVEGFYGTPWSHEVRLSLIDFYGKFKMNSYLYGPKDDPFHRCPNWRLPYPEKEAQNIKELVEACNRNRVDFVWAIHPGQDIKWNEEDYNNLVRKFNSMYDLGVRHFAIFFDDIDGEGANPLKQTELLNRLTDDFVKVRGDVSPLTVCPTDYTKLWANPRENGSLAIYGRTLYNDIKVFWTGDVVCSDLTASTLDFVNSRIKRPAYYWWNFPVTDYARHILMQGPAYGLDTTLTSDDVCGIVSNPMEHGEASKLALYSVADYSWNIGAYNAIDSWERGLEELAPGVSDAYRLFAIHSTDTENGYRRDESWETEIFSLAHWDEEKAITLEAEFKKIEKVPDVMEEGCDNRALLKELRPWLTEFGKLGTRGHRAIELARLYRNRDDNATFWEKYIENLMSREDRDSYNAHKSGTMKLQPFYENITDDMAHGFLKELTGTVPCDYVGIGSFNSARTVLTKQMFDNDSTTYFTSGVAQRADDWVGVDLRCVRDVTMVSVLQGRNSIDDVDYFDHAILEYSTDGKEWIPMIDDMQRQYIINWEGEPVQARYVRLRRLNSRRSNYVAVRSFDVNPLSTDHLAFVLDANDKQEMLQAFDNNIGTSYKSENMAFTMEVASGTTGYTLLMNRLHTPLKCTQWDKNGNKIAEVLLNRPYSEIKIVDVSQVVNIKLEGSTEIFEIITHRASE